MREQLDAGLELVKRLLEKEFRTWPGRINLVTIGLSFIVVLGSGAFDLLQVAIRVWRPEYTTGLPSLIALFAMFIGLGLTCTLLLGLLENRA